MTTRIAEFYLIMLVWTGTTIAFISSLNFAIASAFNDTFTTTIPASLSNIGSSQLSNSIQSDSSVSCCIPVLLAPIATSGNNLYVVWSSNETGHFEIMFRSSADSGQTFTDKMNLSNSPAVDSIDPQIATGGSHVYVSWWEDYGNGRREPFFVASNDNGHTFGPQTRLSAIGPISLHNNVTGGGY